MNIGELDGVKIVLSPEAYAEVKKQKIIEENKMLKEQQQELERYKNIIDELEFYCNMNISMNFNMNNDSLSSQKVENYETILNKLKELKGE